MREKECETMSKRSEPIAPSPLDTSQQAIQAQLNALPSIVSAEQQYAPQLFDIQTALADRLAQSSVDLQAKYGPQYQQAINDQINAYVPEGAAARDLLVSFLGGGSGSSPLAQFNQSSQSALDEYLNGGEVLSDAQRANLQQDIRSAQNVRGFGIASPLGALDESRQLEELRQQIRANRLNAKLGVASQQLAGAQQQAGVGLSALSRVPTGFTDFSPLASYTQPQLVQNTSPSQIFGLTSDIYNTQARLASEEAASNAAALSGIGQFAGSLATAQLLSPSAGIAGLSLLGG